MEFNTFYQELHISRKFVGVPRMALMNQLADAEFYQ